MLAEQGQVILHRDIANKLINGVSIGKLMLAMRKVIITKSSKPFSLSADIKNLKDQPTQQARKSNWDIISNDLKKFNIKLTKDQLKTVVVD
jgi:hypothetical protein